MRYPGHVWSYDFIFERTDDGKTLIFLTIVDGIQPDYLRSDNGSEFVAYQVKKWLLEHGISTHYIDLGSPWQNLLIERFNSIFRTTFMKRWCFLTLAETKALTRQWLEEYNEIRPHGSLRGLSPLQFLWNFRSDKTIINKMKLPGNLTLEVN